METYAIVGRRIYGFCGGHFGRDSYRNKTIIFVGPNCLVAVDDEGNPGLAEFEDWEHMEREVKEWSDRAKSIYD